MDTPTRDTNVDDSHTLVVPSVCGDDDATHPAVAVEESASSRCYYLQDQKHQTSHGTNHWTTAASFAPSPNAYCDCCC